MCRAVKVLCVAPDREALQALRLATTAADWELTPGATNEIDALGLVDAERPHVMVAFGMYEELVSLVRDRFPAMRIVTDRDTPGTSAVASSRDDVRDLLRSLARPGGPIVEGAGAQPPQGSQP
ncbi:MAG: hypothetical protein M3M93_04245 [Actinomycetota bacterium]|nr:hypothetical protein [Actinomycetota bacterium]